MTVVKETSISRYVGDTADTKPTSVPVGSTYLDRQTDALFICYDGTNWTQIDKLVRVQSSGIASGAIASGAVASGAIASGAVASGAVASGAFASGALASGAIANGADVAEGTTTDTPFVGTEDNTARTVISLLKGIKNSTYVSLLGILGATNGAGVVTDADGTVQQYLRGLVKLLVGIISVKIDQTTPGTTNRVHDGWTPALQSDVTANDSDKTFTIPVSTQWQPMAILVDLVTTATVGNRQVTVLITNAADLAIASIKAGVVQAASLTRRYTFGLGLADQVAFVDTSCLTTPLPVLVLPAGYKLRVYDSAAVAAAADDMEVQMLVNARSV